MHITRKAIFFILVCIGIILISYRYYAYEHIITIKDRKEPATTSPVSTSTESITDGSWVWQYTLGINGVIVKPKTTNFILTLSKDNHAMSTTDCNAISSTFVQNGEVLSFAPFSYTEKFCKDSQEVAYRKDLGLATSYTLSKGILKINLNRDAGVMFFSKKISQPGTQTQLGEATLKVEEQKTIEGVGVLVNSVTEDSRCPTDVTCVWKGRVVLNTTLTDGTVNETHDLTLDTPFTFNRHSIMITSVLPHKTKDVTLSPQDYRITIQVTSNSK